MKRNQNGIGRTDIDLGKNLEPLIISHKVAGEARKNLERKKLKSTEDFTHASYGSLEGIIISVGTYYNSPCFTLRARLSGVEIKCVVQGELANSIGAEHSLEEVWANQRVMVEGIISYNAEGEAVNIDVCGIIKIEVKDISLEHITDHDFTGGLSAYQYLERLREGS